MIGTDVRDTGMELRDLLDDPEFLARTGKKRDYHQPFEALRRVAQVFSERPQDVLQELVNVAVSCCGAESAGISLAEPNEAGEPTFRWIAIAAALKRTSVVEPQGFSVRAELASTLAGPNSTESRSPTTISWVSQPNRSRTVC